MHPPGDTFSVSLPLRPRDSWRVFAVIVLKRVRTNRGRISRPMRRTCRIDRSWYCPRCPSCRVCFERSCGVRARGPVRPSRCVNRASMTFAVSRLPNDDSGIYTLFQQTLETALISTIVQPDGVARLNGHRMRQYRLQIPRLLPTTVATPGPGRGEFRVGAGRRPIDAISLAPTDKPARRRCILIAIHSELAWSTSLMPLANEGRVIRTPLALKPDR